MSRRSDTLPWIDKIYLINLDRSKDRLEKCIEQSKKYNFTFERFQAIDGSKITKHQRKYVHPLCNYFCTNGMIGCGLSHYFILKKIVEEEIQTTLVLEDDFIWREDTIQKLNQIKDFDQGILKLSCIGPFCTSSDNGPELSPFALGNAAYLIRYQHAKQLYEQLGNVSYHIDFQYSLVSVLNSIPMYYYDCIDVDGKTDSTIGDQNSTLLSVVLPLSDNWKWLMNEPFIYLFGFNVHLFLILSILLIGLGLFLFLFSKFPKYIGIIFILLGVLDIIYYLLHK
jgi:hypothetical protein